MGDDAATCSGCGTQAEKHRDADPSTSQQPRLFLVLLVAIPLGLLVANLVFLPLPGPLPLIALVAVGMAGAWYVSRSEKFNNILSVDCFKKFVSNKVILGTAITVLLVSQGLALVLGLSITAWRKDFDRALTSQDPCAVERLVDLNGSDDDLKELSKATPEQRKYASAKKKRCLASRQSARRENYEQRCSELTARMDRPLSADDLAVLGASSGLADRISKRALTAEDFQNVGEAAVPCADTPSAGQVWVAYVRSAVSTPGPWSQIGGEPSFSPALWKALTSGNYELSADAAQAFTPIASEKVSKELKWAKTSKEMLAPKTTVRTRYQVEGDGERCLRPVAQEVRRRQEEGRCPG
jgi:hypothetical protein